MTTISYSDIQNGLSWTQAVPVVGPLFGSPVKALVSTAQLIAGLAGWVFGVALSLTIILVPLGEPLTKASWKIVKDGANHLVYSLANLFTLGVLGYRIENGTRA